MTPLEKMAKARHDACIRRIDPKLPGLWDALSAKGQADAIADMRVALLALSEAEFPRELLAQQAMTRRHWTAARVVLRAIAEGQG